MLLGNKPIGTIGYMGGGAISVPEKFCWSFAQMVQYNTEYLCNPGEYIHYTKAMVSYHCFARNSLTTQIQGGWLLMLDTDHEFEPDIAARLIFRMLKYDISILTAIYCYKGNSHNAPVLYQKNDEGFFEQLISWDKTVDILEVSSAGAGCLLAKREIYDRIRNELGEEPFDIIHPFSEDLSFFKRVEKIGEKVFCAVTVEYPHLTIHPISFQKDYKREDFIINSSKEVTGFL